MVLDTLGHSGVSLLEVLSELLSTSILAGCQGTRCLVDIVVMSFNSGGWVELISCVFKELFLLD
jgi:hypothetical protein